MAKRGFSLSQQLAFLKHRFPDSTGSVEKGTMTWAGEFVPSPLSDSYKLRIRCKLTKSSTTYNPKVYIDSPNPLPLAAGAERLPHTYSYSAGKQQLCLYLPKAGEWSTSMIIADTVVHWAVQWMYYYEIWASTGIWMGGGHGNWDVDKKDTDLG